MEIKLIKVDISNEEFQIDLIVYKLYNLTYDEIKIIDPEIEKKITREEWEKFEG